MKLISILLLFIFFVLVNNLNAQNNNKLQEAFGIERINYLQTHYPDSLAYYQFILQDGFRVTEKKYAKPEEIAKAIPISLPEQCIVNSVPQNQLINIFTLPILFKQNENSSYIIEGTDYLLILRSKEYLQKKFSSKPHD